MRAENLSVEQVNAVRSIRDAVPPLTGGTSISKFISENDFDRYISGTFDPETAGFFARSQDVVGLPGAPRAQVRDAMRLDTNAEFGIGGYAVLQIEQPGALISNAGAPKSPGFWSGGNDRLVVETEYPYVGNGFIPSKDGHLRPEYHFGKLSPTGVGENARVELPLGTQLAKYTENGTPLGVWTLRLENGVKIWRQ